MPTLYFEMNPDGLIAGVARMRQSLTGAQVDVAALDTGLANVQRDTRPAATGLRDVGAGAEVASGGIRSAKNGVDVLTREMTRMANGAAIAKAAFHGLAFGLVLTPVVTTIHSIVKGLTDWATGAEAAAKKQKTLNEETERLIKLRKEFESFQTLQFMEGLDVQAGNLGAAVSDIEAQLSKLESLRPQAARGMSATELLGFGIDFRNAGADFQKMYDEVVAAALAAHAAAVAEYDKELARGTFGFGPSPTTARPIYVAPTVTVAGDTSLRLIDEQLAKLRERAELFKALAVPVGPSPADAGFKVTIDGLTREATAAEKAREALAGHITALQQQRDAIGLGENERAVLLEFYRLQELAVEAYGAAAGPKIEALKREMQATLNVMNAQDLAARVGKEGAAAAEAAWKLQMEAAEAYARSLGLSDEAAAAAAEGIAKSMQKIAVAQDAAAESVTGFLQGMRDQVTAFGGAPEDLRAALAALQGADLVMQIPLSFTFTEADRAALADKVMDEAEALQRQIDANAKATSTAQAATAPVSSAITEAAFDPKNAGQIMADGFTSALKGVFAEQIVKPAMETLTRDLAKSLGKTEIEQAVSTTDTAAITAETNLATALTASIAPMTKLAAALLSGGGGGAGLGSMLGNLGSGTDTAPTSGGTTPSGPGGNVDVPSQSATYGGGGGGSSNAKITNNVPMTVHIHTSKDATGFRKSGRQTGEDIVRSARRAMR